jgi:hypothetical protein
LRYTTQCILEKFENQWIWNSKTAPPCSVVKYSIVQIGKDAAVEFGLFPDGVHSSATVDYQPT